MNDNTTLLQALQAIQQQLHQQSQQQIDQNTKILEALNMNIKEQPKHEHNLYVSSSDENKEGRKKSSNNPYARPVGIMCYQCQEIAHTSNKCRATKPLDLVESDKEHNESEDEGFVISHDVHFVDDDDHSEAFLGSSENIISRDIVTRLKLRPKKHPKSYKIEWIKVVGEVRVTEQCDVLFAMGKYKDPLQFDIVDMDACHVLLGRPWQSDFNMMLSLIKNSWSSSFQEGENDGGPKLKNEIKDSPRIIKLD
ncbi:putative receptor protein kinase ZmPK1 [Tanacetum coccineum]|uniref:Receptor protein kinase ZmPK1 n=1 Tax=Tanacetum coccineum TaxID=301880 RepID=A0ABQ5ECG1_9ASTR